MSRAALVILGVLAVAAGCRVGPAYQAPKPATPAAWSQPLAGGLTTNRDTAVRWWTAFQDPTLASLIDRAGAANHDLRLAAARTREARAALAGARAGLWPAADATAGYTRTRPTRNGPTSAPGKIPAEYNLYQTGFDASWELDLFGGTRRAIESSTATVAAAEFAQGDILVSLLAEVAVNYSQVREFQRRIAIAYDTVRAEQDSLDIVKSRTRAGMASELDLAQAEALKAATQAAIPPLETGLAASLHHLDLLLGLPPGALAEELSRPAPVPPPPPTIPVGLPADLLRRRPDIRQAERQLAAATADIGVAAADLYPKLSLTGALGLESVRAADLVSAGSRAWALGPTAQWRLFDAGRIRANIRVHDALREEAVELYEKSVLTALVEVEDALVAYVRERDRFAALSVALEANQRSVTLATELYSKGLSDFLQVVAAESALYSAQDQAAVSRTALTTDVIAVYKAIGGGWEAPAEPAAAARGLSRLGK